MMKDFSSQHEAVEVDCTYSLCINPVDYKINNKWYCKLHYCDVENLSDNDDAYYVTTDDEEQNHICEHIYLKQKKRKCKKFVEIQYNNKWYCKKHYSIVIDTDSISNLLSELIL